MTIYLIVFTDVVFGLQLELNIPMLLRTGTPYFYNSVN